MNLNHPRIHTSEPLTDEDFGRMPWKMPSGEPIPEPDSPKDKARLWLDRGHTVAELLCTLGVGLILGFLAGVNWRG